MQPQSPDTFMGDEWEIRLSIVQSYADKASKGDPTKYLEIMNAFYSVMGCYQYCT